MLGSPLINPIGTVSIGDTVKVSDLFFLPGWGAYISSVVATIPSNPLALKEFIYNDCSKVIPDIVPNDFRIEEDKLFSTDTQFKPGRDLAINVMTPHPSPINGEVMTSCELIFNGKVIGTSSDIGTPGSYNIPISDEHFTSDDYDTTAVITLIYYDDFGNSFRTTRNYLIKRNEPQPLDVYDPRYMNPRLDENGVLYLDNYIPFMYQDYFENRQPYYVEGDPEAKIIVISLRIEVYGFRYKNTHGASVNSTQNVEDLISGNVDTLIFNIPAMYGKSYWSYSKGVLIKGMSYLTIRYEYTHSLYNVLRKSSYTYQDKDQFGDKVFTNPNNMFGKYKYYFLAGTVQNKNRALPSSFPSNNVSFPRHLQGFYKAGVSGSTRARFAVEIGDFENGSEDMDIRPHNLYMSVGSPNTESYVSVPMITTFPLDTYKPSYFEPVVLLKTNTPGYYDIYPTINKSPISRFQGCLSHWGEYLPITVSFTGDTVIIGSHDFHEYPDYSEHTPQYDTNGVLFLNRIDVESQTLLHEVIYEYSDLPQTVRDQVEECYDHMVSTDERAEYIRNAKFGCDVSLSADGKVLAVGMPQAPTANIGEGNSNYQINGKGAVILFNVDWETDPSNPLTVKKVLLPTNDHAFGFGHKLRLTPCGKHLVIECTDFNTTQSRGVTEYKGTTIDRNSNRQVYYYSVDYDRLHETIIPNGDTPYRQSIFATIQSLYPAEGDLEHHRNLGFNFNQASIVFSTDGSIPNTQTYQNGELIHNNARTYELVNTSIPNILYDVHNIPNIDYDSTDTSISGYGIGRCYGRGNIILTVKHNLVHSSSPTEIKCVAISNSDTNVRIYSLPSIPTALFMSYSAEYLLIPKKDQSGYMYLGF